MSDQLRELRALVLDSHSKAFASYNYDQGFQEMRTFVLGHLDALLAAEPEPDPAPSVVMDTNDERFAPLYAAALEWSYARGKEFDAYGLLQDEATRTAGRQIIAVLSSIADQKWSAVIEAALKVREQG